MQDLDGRKQTIAMTVIEYKSKTLVFISDTHGNHRSLDVPSCDFLIHCGDACTDGDTNQLKDFFEWFAEQAPRYKIFIAGNHDLVFDLDPVEGKSMIPDNILYLENEFTIIEGISFYSVSARPWLHEYPSEIRCIDFLITHGPAYGILDLKLGCKNLKKFILKQKPAYHIFGHIHETGGRKINVKEQVFINVSK
jgi:predicted phosphodiesterase